MNNFIEKFKDFLYDIIDYIIIISIIVIVIGIIGWRLDILFADNTVKTPIADSKVVDNNNTSIDNDTSKDIADTKDDAEINTPIQNDKQDSQTISNNPDKNINSDNTQNTKVITINIPKGSLGPAIADILLKEGLIDSKTEFLNRAKELKLDTKLKAGSFKIESNSSLDKIIKIIAGVL
ncbi:hypothetical protein Y919_06820 [Caloranaerobacter azorensis H53214]|uniref:Aminodeoxychorismate lyase n=1 Tax=Caloranaerobacter azorensis H53214 TaxID=1156417 RepID=A0A096BHS3_9FIRM|nr:hypothetical protein [Caloranaerobacter azorensis]KGG80318.1 hypothetical protein Y919_06820 [Caloranaerobacter azorensis H53214]